MKNYTIIRGENKYSAFSGTQLIAQMFKNLNIEANKQNLSKKCYKGFNAMQILYGFVAETQSF